MGKKVLLFDGDLGLANVDVQLGLMPKRDLNDVIRGRLSLDKVVQKFEDGNFDIVAGRSGQASLSALPTQRLAHLRDQLLEVAKDYDVVIADRIMLFLRRRSSSVCSATTSFKTRASWRKVLTSSVVAERAVSPAKRCLPASRNSFDQL